MLQDTIRVLRVIEYVGPRSDVERTIAESIQGTRTVKPGFTIKAATLGAYPEVLESAQPDDKQVKHLLDQIADLQRRLEEARS